MTKPIADRSLCGAKKRQGDGTCRRPAGWGTDHAGRGRCKLHGGAAPQVTHNAELQIVEFQTARRLAELNVPPVADPLTELAKLAGQVLAWRDALAEKVNELTSIRYEALAGGEQLRAEVELFERAMDRCITVLGTIARLKIDERLIRIEQRRIDLVADALAAALADLQLDGATQAQARDGLRRHLRLVAG